MCKALYKTHKAKSLYLKEYYSPVSYRKEMKALLGVQDPNPTVLKLQ